MKQSNKQTILLIEDDPLLINIYSTKFKESGFEVQVADSGEKSTFFAYQDKSFTYCYGYCTSSYGRLGIAGSSAKARKLEKYKDCGAQQSWVKGRD